MTNKNKTKEQLILEVKLLRDEIEETKKVVKTLKESEEKYRNIMELAPDGIVIVDLKGFVVSVNQALVENSGYGKNELIGKHFTKISGFNPKDIPRFMKIFYSILKGIIPEPFEVQWILNDGSIRYGEVHVVLTKIEGKTTGLQAIVRNITERKKTEKELKRSDTNFRNIFNLTSDAIFIKDKKLKILDVNKAAEELFGFTRKELLARPEKTLGDKKKNDYKLADKYVKEALKGIPQRFEWWGLKKDGTSFPEDMLINKTVYNGKDVLLFTIRDITEYKRAEKAQSESEKRFRVLFENTPHGYQSLDRDGNIVEINQSWLDLLGYSRDEVLGKFFGDFLNPVSRNSFIEKFAEFKAAGSVQGAEFEALRKDGSKLIISINGKIGYDEQGKFKQTYCILNDITERKQAQDELIRLKEFNESIVTGMAEGIIVQDADGKIIYINPVSCDLLGYTEEEMLGQHWSLIIPKDQHTIVHSADIRRKKGISDVYELQLIRKDGKQVEVRVSGSPRIEDRQFVGTIAVFTDITERNRTEKALRESEMRFKTIFESSPIGVLLTSPEGNFIQVNKHFEKMTMYSAEELNIHFKDITHPDDVDKSMIMLKKLLNGEIQSAKFEKRYIKKNGEVIHCNLNVAPVKIYGEKIEYFIATVEDITKRKQAVESLLQSEKRYRRVVENAIDIIFQHDIEGYFTFLNPVATRSTGYSEEELIGMHYTTLVHSDDLNHIKDFFERQFQERIKEGEYECRIVTKTGKSIWIRAYVTMLTEGNRIIGWQSIGRDVTDRKMAEEALHKAHELLQTTQNSLLDAVITTDMNYNIVSCNKAVMKIFGYTPEELIGKNYLFLVSEEMSENADQETRQAELFEKGYLERDDFYFKRKNGKSFPASFSVALIKDEKSNTTGLVGAVHDITERKQKEEKIKRQLDELQRWHRLVLDREDRVQELKREVNELLKQQNQDIRYSSQEPNSGKMGNDKR